MTGRLAAVLVAAPWLGGCAAVTVVDAAVGTAATAVETTAEATAGAVDLAVPDEDGDEG